MRSSKHYRILLVAGDYEVIQVVSRALSTARFDVQNAFNHRDAVYLLSIDRYDAAMVDARMTDRYSGAVTLTTLQGHLDIPLIALATDAAAIERAQQSSLPYVTTLDARAIRKTTGRTMGVAVEGDTDLLVERGGDPVLVPQIEEVNTLFALSKSLTEVLDLNEVLNRVVEAARSLTQAQEGMLLLPEGSDLYLRAKAGMDVNAPRYFRVRTRDSLAGRVYETGEPVLIGNSGPQKVKTAYFVNALLYVPIVLKGETIGVLGVNNRTEKGEFTLHHQQLLLHLAAFAAVAIQNARVHEEILARNRALETLVETGQAFNATVALEDAIPNVCRHLTETIGMDGVELLAWDRERNTLMTQGRYMQSWWPIGRGPTIELDTYPDLRDAVKPRDEAAPCTWLGDDPTANPQTVAMLKQAGASVLLVIPVFADDQLLGVVRTFYVRRLTEDLDSGRYNAVRKLSQRVVASLLNGTDRGLTPTLIDLCHGICTEAQADWCDISLPISRSTALSVMVAVGHAAWLEQPMLYLSLDTHPELSRWLEMRRSFTGQADDMNVSRSVKGLLNRQMARSLLAVPMTQGDETRGLFMFWNAASARTFNDRDVMLARAVVSQASIALENARLVHDLETSLNDLRTAQNRLVQTARLSAMGELASVVAHQMNNPLTTIIVDTELMLLDEPADSPRRDALQAIARTGKRAANVARRLLAITRPPDGDAPPDFIDVVDSVRGIVSLLQAHFEHANMRLVVDLPDHSLPVVQAAKGRMDDIWLNLLMNAYDSLHESQTDDAEVRVQVSFAEDQKQIEVLVEDNGPGIPPGIQEQIFSPFFTTKPIGEGTGLGLHISREVVESAGGTIQVYSRPSQPTRFVVRLPIHKREA